MLFLTGWDPAPVEHEPPHCGHLQPPIRAWKFRQPEIGVKAEAHRDRAVAVGDKRRFQRQAVGAEPFMQLKVLSAKTGVTVQELNLEALNVLFERHQVSRIAR